MWSLKQLQDRVSSLFYLHGLFCASHPFAILCLVIITVFSLCLPLARLPIPTNAPEHFTTPSEGYKPPSVLSQSPQQLTDKQPRWYFGRPVTYVQQILVKSVVSPWDRSLLIPSDAYRSPLATAFDIVDLINRFTFREGDTTVTIQDICLQITDSALEKKVKERLKDRGQGHLLPEHNCLVLSPANLWNNDKNQFASDHDVTKRVFENYGQPLDTPPTIRDILFGVPWKDTGLKRYYIRNKERAISYAITIMLSRYDAKFLEALEDRLLSTFPETASANTTKTHKELVHIHFKGINYVAEYTPLLVTYALLFMYIYFSVSKIEMVKSKWGLALSAVITVVASLLISVSICFFFGITPSLSGSEIFPYLVVIIGLENNLVITKSVVSTPVHLDVKLRVAKGLSKEGWYIFKNMLLELGVLAFGFISMVPAIQEFCLFAFVGLVSDTFLQMFFFTTVVAIDIKRMECCVDQLTDIHRHGVHTDSLHLQNTPMGPVPRACPVMAKIITARTPQPPKLPRNPSSLGLNRIAEASAGYKAKTSSSSSSLPSRRVEAMGRDDTMFRETDDVFTPETRRTPRRVKLLNFWARTRIIQRAIMVSVVVWVLLFVYKTSLVDDVTDAHHNVIATSDKLHPSADKLSPKVLQYSSSVSSEHGTQEKSLSKPSQPHVKQKEGPTKAREMQDREGAGRGEEKNWLQTFMREEQAETWKRLAHGHWPTLLGYYNISLGGRYITFLPPIYLSQTLSPQYAINMRHSQEKTSPANQQGYWHHSEDLHHSDDLSPNKSSPLDLVMQRLVRSPRTRLELVATVLFVVASFVLMAFTLIYMYKCMCSRNYAKWRSSWERSKRSRKGATYYKKIRESLPIVLRGHSQEVECLNTDGPLVVSSCLGGQLRVWDSLSGQCITNIDRKSITPIPPETSREPAAGRNMDDSEADLYAEYHGNSLASSPDKMDCSVYARTPLTTTPQNKMAASPPQSTSPREIRPQKSYFFESNSPGLGASPPVPSGGALGRLSQQSHQGIYSSPHNTAYELDAVYSGSRRSCLSSGSSQDCNHGDCSSMHVTRRPSHTRHRSADFNHVDHFPDLSDTIDTDFSHSASMPRVNTARAVGVSGYDFSRFDECYEEHKKMMSEKQRYEMRKRSSVENNDEDTEVKRRSWSISSSPHGLEDDEESSLFLNESSLTLNSDSAPAIWCMACKDNLIVVGCGNGRLEFWDGLGGVLKYIHQHSPLGVTNVCLAGHKVIAARLDGSIDFLELETFINTNKSNLPPTRSQYIHNRGHMRQPSNPSLADLKSCDDIIHVTLLSTSHAHQQPINKLLAESSRVVSASQDHTLKVFRLEDSLCLYTLHGHLASVTALFLDQHTPLAATSGSEDGDVRVWDMLTGACVHKLQGHVNTVTAITCTPAYVISAGMDDRLCVWERCKGSLLHWIQMEAGFCNSVAMLTSNLMVTGGQGRLYLWDVTKGEVLRAVALGDYDCSVFVNQLLVIDNSAVICDYGNQICVINFPSVLEKSE